MRIFSNNFKVFEFMIVQ